LTGVSLHGFLDGQNGRSDDLGEGLLVDRTLDGNVWEVGVDFRIGRRASGGVVGGVFVVLSYRAEDEGEVADELETEELDRKNCILISNKGRNQCTYDGDTKNDR
jgi:hypothetical protein